MATYMTVEVDPILLEKVRASLDANGVGRRKLRKIMKDILAKEFETHLAGFNG